MNKNTNNPGLFINNLLEEVFNSSISNIIGSDYSNHSPAVNITDQDASLIISLAAPGLTKKDFIISLDGNKLTIAVNKEVPNIEGATYKRREFDYSKFNRTFPIPNNVDKEKIDAKYDNGILELVLPKLEKPKSSTIEIK